MGQRSDAIKKDFPIFAAYPKLVYLDNASTTQTPQVVLDAMNNYYTKYRANIHRGVYKLSGEATEMYEGARQVAADFLGARFEEIVFTSGATQGLNMLAQSLCSQIWVGSPGETPRVKPGDNVVLSRMEHHANLIPWVEMSRRYGFEVRWIELTSDFRLQTSDLPIDEQTKIVSFTLVSNTLGTINPAKEIIARAKKVGATTIVDAAQAVAHMLIDVRRLDVDFLVFSGHKMYGPTGIGVLYGKKERLEMIDPAFFGGDMIKEVTFEKATWNDFPWKFEAGTPNIAGAIGLAAAIQYLERIGWQDILEHEAGILIYTLQELQKIEGLNMIGPSFDFSPYQGERGGVFEATQISAKKELLENLAQGIKRPHLTSPHRGGTLNRVGVISFTLDRVHPHDIASILDTEYNIAVRAGHHCTMPLMQYLGIHGTTRASFGIYSSKEDVDRLCNGIREAKKIFI